ncbi:U2 small nuclear ribonucleoprotein auxiliary factor 35 kDa subunit-related protein 1-like [Astyanax mexicanus]|uniref:DDRGK domain-containing protein 1-like n=1 Tax=Astyanax mexicanus TaxID=7994 RepID=A0A8T2MEN3_ASTMX|nr:U2 small nuclear ribonucleoprotein auxiliary factor 35 kDa subunit-related protein 1-like [Astyanax mexicanus]KAG9280365.1 DDRGK domain-containing protein 1-like [Astyanax mexicanus]
MAHIKRFAGIPMSKCMREMCREEDYMFLQDPRDQGKTPEGTTLQDTEWQQKREERIRRRVEREQQEQERQRQLEEQQRKKEEEWRSHVAKLASERESLRDRLHRLREFRDFQKKVLIQDLGLDPDSSNEKLTKILRRL